MSRVITEAPELAHTCMGCGQLVPQDEAVMVLAKTRDDPGSLMRGLTCHPECVEAAAERASP